MINQKIAAIFSHILMIALNKKYGNIFFSNYEINDNGISCQFKADASISINDFPKIKKEIQKVIDGSYLVQTIKITDSNSINALVQNKTISDFVAKSANSLYALVLNNYKSLVDIEISDMKTNCIKAFDLYSIGAIHNEQNSNTIFKIDCVAFDNKEDFEQFSLLSKERLERDHRRIGKELNLFGFDLLAGQGLPIWLPNGNIIKKEIRNFLSDLEFKYNFDTVSSPVLGSVELYKKSGHWDHYQENMFPVMKVDNEELVLRPMTCPHHILIFKKNLYSYKQLPIRMCEESMLHRYESSGGLIGLERVREMILEDTHIFCTKDQIEQEVINCYNIIQDAYKSLNCTIHQIDLAVHDPSNIQKFHSDSRMWEYAESSLREVLKKNSINFVEKVGEAAFYGPKIDFQVKTSLNKIITMSTIQLDFLLPEKFELQYKDKDGQFVAPIMIHLGIIGTYERLLSIILEQTKGKLPVWLSPVQLNIIPVNYERHNDYCQMLHEKFKAFKIRTNVDNRDERLSKKIRESQTSKIPFLAVIGDEEIGNNKISIREYGSEKSEIYEVDKFITILRTKIYNKL